MNKLLKGWRSSEFWIATLAAVATLAAPFVDNKIAGAAASSSLPMALLAGAYAIGRSWVKRKALELETAKEVTDAAKLSAWEAARASAESARAGEAANLPPMPTGGNRGEAAPTIASTAPRIAQAGFSPVGRE